jgi:LytS/YehU family sensor histidine kinase
MPDYPESHPKHAEIADLKSRINEHFSTVQSLTDEARHAYQEGHQSLTQMGNNLKCATENLKEVVKLMKELEAVVTSPLI